MTNVTGTMTGTGTVTLSGGKLQQSSDIEAVFDKLTADAGSVVVDANKSMTGNAFVMNGAGTTATIDGTAGPSTT